MKVKCAIDSILFELKWPRCILIKYKIVDALKVIEQEYEWEVMRAKQKGEEEGRRSIPANPEQIERLESRCKQIEGEKDYYLNLLTVEQLKNQNLVKLCAEAQMERDILNAKISR